MSFNSGFPIRGKAQRELVRSIKRAEAAEERAANHRYELECKLGRMQFDRMMDVMLGRPVHPRASAEEREHAEYVFGNLLREAKREDEMREAQRRARTMLCRGEAPQSW